MQRAEEKRMVDFLLVHGANTDAGAWERLIPVLRADTRVGKVIAPDMPGRGSNRVGQFSTIRLNDYLATITEALCQHNLQDAILVGHSAGGICLPAAMAAAPERIRRIVFLSAVVPESNRSFLDLQPRRLRMLTRAASWLLRANQRGIKPSQLYARWALGPDLLPEDRDKISAALLPEPRALITDHLDWSSERAQVPATYICTTKDRVVRPKSQRRMARKLVGAEVIELPTGHAYPVLYPQELAAILLRYA